MGADTDTHGEGSREPATASVGLPGSEVSCTWWDVRLWASSWTSLILSSHTENGGLIRTPLTLGCFEYQMRANTSRRLTGCLVPEESVHQECQLLALSLCECREFHGACVKEQDLEEWGKMSKECSLKLPSLWGYFLTPNPKTFFSTRTLPCGKQRSEPCGAATSDTRTKWHMWLLLVFCFCFCFFWWGFFQPHLKGTEWSKVK